MVQNKTNTNRDPFALDPEHQERASGFLQAVGRIFRPICRFFVRRGIGFLRARDLLSQAYVLAAADVANEQGQPVTTKRIALYTGLPSKEVERLQAEVASDTDYSEPMFLAMERLLSMWHQDSKYVVLPIGVPLELPFTDREGRGSFTSLVKDSCGELELDPKLVLAELLETKHVVEVPENNLLQVKERAYIPERFTRADSDRMGLMVSNYLETLYKNSRKAGRGLGYYERSVTAEYALSPEDERQFQQLVRERCQALLEDLDHFLLGRKQVGENGRRVGLASFFFVDITPGGRPEVVGGGDPNKPSSGEDTRERSSTNENEVGVIDTLLFDNSSRRK